MFTTLINVWNRDVWDDGEMLLFWNIRILKRRQLSRELPPHMMLLLHRGRVRDAALVLSAWIDWSRWITQHLPPQQLRQNYFNHPFWSVLLLPAKTILFFTALEIRSLWAVLECISLRSWSKISTRYRPRAWIRGHAGFLQPEGKQLDN